VGGTGVITQVNAAGAQINYVLLGEQDGKVGQSWGWRQLRARLALLP
jgi:hypothetical protein